MNAHAKTRRTLIRLLSLGLFGFGEIPRSWAQQQTTPGEFGIYLDQSGRANEPYFAIGCLVCSDVAQVLSSLSSIREDLKYTRTLHAHSRDSAKLAYFTRIVDDQTVWNSLQFFVRIRKRVLPAYTTTPEERVSAYINDLVSTLTMPKLTGVSSVKLVTQDRNIGASIGSEEEDLVLQKIPPIKSIQREQLNANDVLQLVDMVTGTVRQAIIDKDGQVAPAMIRPDPHRNAVKAKCQQKLLNALSAGVLAGSIHHPRCIVRILD